MLEVNPSSYLVERVVIAHDAPDVSQHFQYASADHCYCKAKEASREHALEEEDPK